MTVLLQVVAFAGGMFHCPDCELRNYFAERKCSGEPGTNGETPPDVEWPEDWHICEYCGYELTLSQQEPARPMDSEGGVILPTWHFKCADCGVLNYCDVTIYLGGGRERPPSRVVCLLCRSFFSVRLGDVDEADEFEREEADDDEAQR
jgi:hypothetical protein